MSDTWKHLLLGGGLLVLLRHIGFAIGFGCQVVWEGFLDGVNARKAANQDATSFVDAGKAMVINDAGQTTKAQN